jgi:competence protein ComEA
MAPHLAAMVAAAFLIACRGPVPQLSAAPAVADRPAVASAADEPVGARPRSVTPKTSARRPAKPTVVGQVNLNRATEAELRLLPGIGKLRAKAIVERRQGRPFASLDEVARIRGLKSVVRRLRAHLTLDGPTTVRAAPAGKGG